MENVMTRPRRYSDENQADVPDLSIVLVCWNNKDYLGPCLDSLYEGNLKSSFDVIVVDNGSTDGSQAMLREKYPDVKIIQNEDNVGLGKASNQGIVATQGRYVLLLNNDTIVNGPSFDAMVEFLDNNPNTAAVGPQLQYPDGTIQTNYNKFSTLREELLIATRIGELIWPGYPANTTDTEIRSVDWMSSACLIVRRTALDQVGLLDEEYFIYGDEADLQYRLKQAGWDMHYLPQAVIIHFGGRSMNRWGRRRMVYRGKMLFYKKHYGPLPTLTLRVMLGVLSSLKLILWALALLLPSGRDRARKELASNIDVIKLCWYLA